MPANPYDSVYCVRLAHAAVHAGMAGRTELVVTPQSKESAETAKPSYEYSFDPSRPESALAREESRGGHFRSDFPQRDDIHWKRRASETRDAS